MDWLIDETKPLDMATLERSHEDAPAVRGLPARRATNLAIRLMDLVVLDNRKLFGGADIRLDTLVVHGQAAGASADSFYQPQTHRFSGVEDGKPLLAGEENLLVFYGRPRHFVDISIMASRDRQDTEDLSNLIASRAASPEFKASIAAIVGLAVAAPPAAAIGAAAVAAITLGNTVGDLLGRLTGNTIGLYRVSYLYGDSFGLGRHPQSGHFDKSDLRFSYEVVRDQA